MIFAVETFSTLRAYLEMTKCSICVNWFDGQQISLKLHYLHVKLKSQQSSFLPPSSVHCESQHGDSNVPCAWILSGIRDKRTVVQDCDLKLNFELKLSSSKVFVTHQAYVVLSVPYVLNQHHKCRRCTWNEEFWRKFLIKIQSTHLLSILCTARWLSRLSFSGYAIWHSGQQNKIVPSSAVAMWTWPGLGFLGFGGFFLIFLFFLIFPFASISALSSPSSPFSVIWEFSISVLWSCVVSPAALKLVLLLSAL